MALSDSKYTVTELTRSKGAMEASLAQRILPPCPTAFLHRSSIYLLTGYLYLFAVLPRGRVEAAGDARCVGAFRHPADVTEEDPRAL